MSDHHTGEAPSENEEYDALLNLEEMESLLEELEEGSIDGKAAGERLRTLGVAHVRDLPARIEALHRELDSGAHEPG